MSWDGATLPAQTIALVKCLEPLHLAPQEDGSGAWTIGYGARRDLAGGVVGANTAPITGAEAEALLRRDLAPAVQSVGAALKRSVEECEAAALISLAASLGNLTQAAPSLIGHVNAGRRREAAGQFQAYVMRGGHASVALRRRRWVEAAVYLGMEPAVAAQRAWAEIAGVQDWPPLPP